MSSSGEYSLLVGCIVVFVVVRQCLHPHLLSCALDAVHSIAAADGQPPNMFGTVLHQQWNQTGF